MKSQQAEFVAKLLCRHKHRALHPHAPHPNDRLAALPDEVRLCRVCAEASDA